jgi:hypothetical protein
MSTRDYLQLTRARWIHSGLLAGMRVFPILAFGMFVPAAT